MVGKMVSYNIRFLKVRFFLNILNSSNKIKTDDLSCWNVKKSFNNNEIENIDDEERSIAFSK